MLTEIRTATITSKGQIVIPKEMREHKSFKEGKKVAIIAMGDRIQILPVEIVEEELIPILVSKQALSDWERKEEDDAWKHL